MTYDFWEISAMNCLLKFFGISYRLAEMSAENICDLGSERARTGCSSESAILKNDY